MYHRAPRVKSAFPILTAEFAAAGAETAQPEPPAYDKASVSPTAPSGRRDGSSSLHVPEPSLDIGRWRKTPRWSPYLVSDFGDPNLSVTVVASALTPQ